MSAPAARSARRPRRSQKERSAATRAKLIRAATDCTAELGFRGATMTTIAARAGVSFGSIQHQFGDKDAILDAVLEASLEDLESALSGIRAEHPDPVDRVAAFVSRCRALLRGPSYRAFVEIQLGRGRERSAADGAWAQEVATTLRRIWNDLFGDLGLSKRRLDAAQRFTFVVLSGIASESMLFPGAGVSRSHFEILEDTLLRHLEL